MFPPVSRSEMREIDRRAITYGGIPSLVLMENAGAAAAYWIYHHNAMRRPVVICCGKGNNGGDGLVIARRLERLNISAVVLLFAEPEALSPDAAVNYRRACACNVSIRRMHGSALESELRDPARMFGAPAWIVDCLFGTGLVGPVRPPYDRIIRAMNEHEAAKLAIDIPSGLDADTGEATDPTVRATATLTFVAAKLGFSAPTAQEFLGHVSVLDIHIPGYWVDEVLRERMPQVPNSADMSPSRKKG